jgi:hypothetical protein
MTQQVEFLMDCANDRKGEKKAIEAKRAKRLAWTGYVRIIVPDETAVVDSGAEKAIKDGSRGGRTERRG